MVKGDRLRYDTIAAIYFLITYKTGGGGGEKRHLVDLRSKRKVKRIEYIPNTGAYIYIYIHTRLSSIAPIRDYRNFVRIM